MEEKYFRVNKLEKHQDLEKSTQYAVIKFKIFDDPKIHQLNNTERWLWISCILLACQNDNHVLFSSCWIRDVVMFKSPQCLRAVKQGLDKFLNLELISLCDKDIDREIDRKREKSSSSFKKTKPTFKGQEMRKQGGKWWVIPKGGGKWLEFSLKEKDIEWV